MRERTPSRLEAIARKEFIQIARDPRTLGIALLMPILLLVLYGYAISTDVKSIPTAVFDQDQSRASREFLDQFTASGYFQEAMQAHSIDEITRAIDAGTVRVAIIIPPTFSKNLSAGRMAPVSMIVDGTEPNTATVASGYLEAISAIYSNKVVLDTLTRRGLPSYEARPPLEMQSRVWYNPDLRSINYIVPGTIAIILMMTSALLTSVTIARERERGTMEQLIASPIKSYELMVGKTLAYVVLAMADIVLVVLIADFWFKVPIRGSILLLFALSLIFLMSSLGIGLRISATAKTQQSALLGSVLATVIPGYILSGFMFPIASMPKAVQLFTYLIPARYYLVIVRGIFLKGAGLSILWEQVVPMTVFGLILITMSIRSFRKTLI